MHFNSVRPHCMDNLSIELNPEKQEDVLNEIDEKGRLIFYF